jgi:predicted transcriptional regulator
VSIKEQAIRLVESMPDNVTWAQALERIQIAAALSRAEAEIDSGRFATQDQVEAHIDSCLRKLSGPSAA